VGPPSLKDQLKQWARDTKPAEGPVPVAKGRGGKDRGGRDGGAARARRGPVLSTIRRDEPPPTTTAAPPPTEAELFAQALEQVGPDVVLSKFGAAPVGPAPTLPPPPPPSDSELFLQAVGQAVGGDQARRSAPAPDVRPTLALPGAGEQAACRRALAHVDEAVRAGALEAAVTELGADVVDAVRRALVGHRAVAGVRDTRAGGQRGLLVRLR
jgi:hypothetical protein